MTKRYTIREEATGKLVVEWHTKSAALAALKEFGKGYYAVNEQNAEIIGWGK